MPIVYINHRRKVLVSYLLKVLTQGTCSIPTNVYAKQFAEIVPGYNIAMGWSESNAEASVGTYSVYNQFGLLANSSNIAMGWSESNTETGVATLVNTQEFRVNNDPFTLNFENGFTANTYQGTLEPTKNQNMTLETQWNGNAAKFVNATTLLEYPLTLLFNTFTFTISVSAMISTTASNSSLLGARNGATQGFGIGVNTAGKAYFSFYNGDVNLLSTTMVSVNSIPINTPFNITVIRDTTNNNMNLYVNGVLERTIAVLASRSITFASGVLLMVGRDVLIGGTLTNGYVDDIAISVNN